ncbi:hypothetical protein ACP275_04G045100 [Erythranthe tilingii]
MLLSAINTNSCHHSSLPFPTRASICTSFSRSISCANFLSKVPGKPPNCIVKRLSCSADSRKSDQESETNPNQNSKSKSTEKKTRKAKNPENEAEKPESSFPPMIPKKPRRGRKSEAAAVEDFVRDSLGKTFESIRNQNPEILKNMENIMKEKSDRKSGSDDDDSSDEDSDDEDELGESGKKEMLIEEEDPNWPLDADIGWGIKASEYFNQHPIKNVVGEDGKEINWEGEIDDALVKEINCLEWESFAFHPSPLIVLVFERYNRASDNWKVLKELEKAAEVYWKAKDRLPPRTVKIDMNIERDLAYALKVKECPQILFLRGNKILYREKDTRSSDELVQMIAHFYYNAKKPSFINDADLSSPKQWR